MTTLRALVPSLSLILFCSACQQKGSSRATSGTGSVVGNGLISYSNAEMAIEFDFPQGWTLEESSDRRALRLVSRTNEDVRPISTISFLLMDEYDGRTFEFSRDLGAYLVQRFPTRSWKEVLFRWGQSGYYWKRILGDRALAEFFVLDSRNRVLWVYYDASLSSRELETIQRITDSLSAESSGEPAE